METLTVSIEQISIWIDDLLMIFVRVGAMVGVVPVLGSALIPVRVRVLIAVLITLSVFPAVPPVTDYEIFSWSGLTVLFYQFLIGMSMGFIFQLVFNAVTIAGENIAITMGLGFAQIVDPQNGIQVPVISQFYAIVTILLFLALDLHGVLIEMVRQSFITLPVLSTGFQLEFIWRVLEWGAQMFIGAVLIGIPIITGLLVVNITMGVMARAAPQLNIFAVGFPITMLIGFLLMLLSMPVFLPRLQMLVGEAFAEIEILIKAT